jgi:GNAT superfamily N-acetyltransferase
MAGITVTPVTSHGAQRQFLAFPQDLYQGDPLWVPPICGFEEKLAGFSPHPFYRTAQAQAFLATGDGKVCGRILAVLNRAYNQYYEQPLGFFGFFESINDRAVATALFDAVRDWFAARGIRSLCGPINPGFEYTVGLLVEGFDSPPMFLTTYNPAYYADLLKACGLEKSQDLLAYGGNIGMLPEISARYAPIAQQITDRYGIRVRKLSWRQMLDRVEEVTDIYNRSMGKHWGFVPIPPADARHMIQQMRHLLIPEFTLAAEIDGRLVAFLLGLPDYNPCIRQIDGRLFPDGLLGLPRGKRRFNGLRIFSANVCPEYQHLGIPLVLLLAMSPASLKLGIERVEFSWILESNRLSCGSLEKGGAALVKRYRVFGWQAENASRPNSEISRSPQRICEAYGQPAEGLTRYASSMAPAFASPGSGLR